MLANPLCNAPRASLPMVDTRGIRGARYLVGVASVMINVVQHDWLGDANQQGIAMVGANLALDACYTGSAEGSLQERSSSYSGLPGQHGPDLYLTWKGGRLHDTIVQAANAMPAAKYFSFGVRPSGTSGGKTCPSLFMSYW